MNAALFTESLRRQLIRNALSVSKVIGLYVLFASSTYAEGNELKPIGKPATLIVGVASVPEFQGSDTSQSAPLVVSRFRVADKPIQISGTQLRLGIAEERTWWAGPQLNIVGARDDSVSDERISSFEPVDLSFELGGFVSFRQPMGRFEEGLLESSASFNTPVSGDWEGTSIVLETEYSWAATFMLRLAVGASVMIADDDYAVSRFGVSEIDANRSGLQAYVPGGGLQSATVSIRSLVSLSPRWGIFTRFAYTELLQDAKDSPIVTEAGSADQLFAGLGIFWVLSK